MPRTVKLTSADARAWRENRPQWVSPDGHVLRAVTEEEEKALFPVFEQVKRFQQSGSCHVDAVYKVADSASGQITEQKVPLSVQVHVTKTGREQGAFLSNLFVGGNRYVKGREVLRARILEKHGDCLLQGPNGKQICVLRDPRVNRPSFAESQRMAPSPERCHCRGFKDNPELGRHHIACEWNAKAPPHERALPIQRESAPRGMMDLQTPITLMAFDAPMAPPVARSGPGTPPPVAYQPNPPSAALPARPLGGVAALAVPVVLSGPAPVSQGRPLPPPPPPGVAAGAAPAYAVPEAPAGVQVYRTPSPPSAPAPPSPSECDQDCRGVQSQTKGWAWPAGRVPEPNQHHPLCKHAAAWRRQVSGARAWMLYDLDRKVELREATAEEQARADVELGRSGIRSVQVGERLYAVVEAGSAPAAATSPRSVLAPRPTPSQDALRSLSAPSAGVHPQVVGRAAAPAALAPAPALRGPDDLSIDELEQLLARRRALAAAPNVPTASPVDELSAPAWGEPLEVAETPEPLPSEESDADLELAEPEALRDERGLVGLQQRSASIEPGPVSLPLPEPFVDPLEGSRDPGSGVRVSENATPPGL